MVTSSKYPAFNSREKRFGKITVHPNLDPSGLYTVRPDGCDPCRYQPIHLQQYCAAIHSKAIDKDPWRYKSELEAWAQNLGYRNQKVLEQRKWNRALLGPAWHYVEEPPKYTPACMNVGFGRTPRILPSRNFLPGPGTYYKEHPYKAPYGPHSVRPTFEREEPCRFKDTVPKWSLAPDRYKILDKECIAEKSNKVVSLKGPYNLFSGKRDGSSIKNHFNTSLRCECSTWPITLPFGCLDTYKKSHFGTMNKTGRNLPHRGRNTLVDGSMCIRKPAEPGPAQYNLRTPELKQNKRAFNSSYDKPPGYQRQIVWPGVGRYRITAPPYRIRGHGHKSVFLCKLGRTIGAVLPQPMNSF